MQPNIDPISCPAICEATASVWFTATDAVQADELLNDYKKLLDDTEQARYESFRFSKDRHLYLVAHALLRTSLSQRFAVPPRDWRFKSQDGERPEIVQCHGTRVPLRFSLSHTPGLAACIIAKNLDVGVDVENVNRELDTQGISSRYFASSEVQQLAGLSKHARRTRFFEYWTLKEAYLKARGLGLSVPLNSFCFHQDRSGAWRIEFLSPDESAADAWWFVCVRPSPDHVLSVAIRDPDMQIEEFTIGETIPLSGPTNATPQRIPKPARHGTTSG